MFISLKSSVPIETKRTAPFILIPILFILSNIFLGFEGVEFDLDKQMVRHYRRRLGIKTGRWQDLSQFNLICLSMQFVSSSGLSTVDGNGSYSKNYEVNLASLETKAILLAECKSYTEGLEKLKYFGDKIGIETRDLRKEELEQKAKKRRF